MTRKISNRLSKLELSDDTKALDSRAMLVEVLARRDAWYHPWRYDKAQHLGRVRELQEAYEAGTLGIPAKASGRVDWLNASEQRSALVAAGLCKATKSSGGEVSGLRLTPEGEALARRLAGDLPTLQHPVVRNVYVFLCATFDIAPPWLHGRWVSESVLWGRTLAGDSAEFDWLNDYLLPLITAGLVKALHDGQGRLYYSLTKWTPSGELLVSDLDCPTSNAEPDAKLEEEYYTTYKVERARLETLEGGFELTIPVPASCFHKLLDESSTGHMTERGRDLFLKKLEERRNVSKWQELIESTGEVLRTVSSRIRIGQEAG